LKACIGIELHHALVYPMGEIDLEKDTDELGMEEYDFPVLFQMAKQRSIFII
jgi:hypothetical protein